MRNKRIAALMAGADREYQQAFTQGMVHAAAAKGIDLCVFNCQGHPDGFVRNDWGERAIFELPELPDFDGVVALIATIPTAACRMQIVEKFSKCPGLPVVTIDGQVEGSIKITFDDRASMQELMNHLVDVHNIQRVVMLTGPRESNVAMRRCEVCRQVLAERGIMVPESAMIEGHWVRESGYQAAEQLLESGKPLPDAVICGNDDMALGLIERLGEAGLSVPDDILVTGFDALQEAEGRGLTTVSRPVEEAGRRAVELLDEWSAQGRPQEQEVMLPTRVVYGMSCGCPLDGSRSASYVRMLTAERRMAEWSLRQAATFFGGLAGLSGQVEAGAHINAFAKTWGARDLYVCVDPSFLHHATSKQTVPYPDEMLLLSGWSAWQEEPQCHFPTRQLLPRLEAAHDEPLALVFSPLYAMNRNLGYTVSDVAHASGYVQYSLLTLLSGALMSLGLQSTVRDYAAELEKKSTHDSLTGLYNRKGFNKIGMELFDEAKRTGQCLAIVSCDMDGMKLINDRLGHLKGDEAIRRMGEALRALECEGMTCIHISGDEFLAVGIVPDETKAEELLVLLRESIDRLNREDPWDADIAASMGAYAAVPRAGNVLNDFLVNADRCMYAEKSRHHDKKES